MLVRQFIKLLFSLPLLAAVGGSYAQAVQAVRGGRFLSYIGAKPGISPGYPIKFEPETLGDVVAQYLKYGRENPAFKIRDYHDLGANEGRFLRDVAAPMIEIVERLAGDYLDLTSGKAWSWEELENYKVKMRTVKGELQDLIVNMVDEKRLGTKWWWRGEGIWFDQKLCLHIPDYIARSNVTSHIQAMARNLLLIKKVIDDLEAKLSVPKKPCTL